MKKITVVLAVLLLLAFVQMGQAADLQAGWYVKLGGIATFGTDPQTHLDVATQWHFTSALGNYGPFEVTSPDPVWAERMVYVSEGVTGVATGTSLYLWSQPDTIINYDITAVVFPWESNYDKSVVQLELLMYSSSSGYTKLWSYTQTPYNSDFSNVLTFPQKIPVGYVPVLRVNVVPEPTSLIILITGLMAYTKSIWRKKTA